MGLAQNLNLDQVCVYFKHLHICDDLFCAPICICFQMAKEKLTKASGGPFEKGMSLPV